MNDEELERLAAYKYKPGMYTVMDNVLTPWWNYAVKLLPPTMAPNLVTLTGFVGVLVTVAPVFVFSPTLTEDAPAWVFVSAAAGMLIYQTLDAIDGKQARRTRTSSPLGELFDHGMDAVNSIFSMTCAAAATGSGGSAQTVALFFSVFFSFYVGTWGEYRTGVLRHGSKYLGVTEAQLLLVATDLASAAFGVGWWDGELLAGCGFSRRTAIISFVVLGNVQIVAENLWQVFCRPCELTEEEIGEKELSAGSAVRHIFPTLLVLGGGAAWMHAAQDDFAARPHVFLFAVGLIWAHITIAIIIAHMSKSPLRAPLLRCALPALAAVYTAAGGADAARVPLLLLALNAVGLFVYVHSCLSDITQYLGIYCLRQGKRL